MHISPQIFFCATTIPVEALQPNTYYPVKEVRIMRISANWEDYCKEHTTTAEEAVK